MTKQLRLHVSASLLCLLLLDGCGSMDIRQFSGGAPSMAPENWMAGTVDGYGVIVDRFGNVKSQFHAHEVGVWDTTAHRLTLTEQITYLQGSDDPPTGRVWQFTEISPGHWQGKAIGKCFKAINVPGKTGLRHWCSSIKIP